MLKRINKSILLDIGFIILLSLTPLLWFKQEMMMVGHDNVFPLNPIEFFKGRLYTWSSQDLGQDQSLIMGTLPIHLIDTLPYLLGFSLQTTQKIVFLFWFFLIGLSAYALASVINPKNRFFKLTASVLYQFNFFILQGWFIAERTKFAVYIALPLVLSVFLLVYEKKLSPLKAAIYNALLLLLFSGGGLLGIHLFGGFFVSLLLFFIFFGSLAILGKNYLVIKNLFLALLISILAIFLINAYSIFPLLSKFLVSYQAEVSASGGLKGFIEWAQEISVGSSFINLFRLQGIAEWYDNPDHPYAQHFLTNKYLIFTSFLWPLLTLLPLILTKERKKMALVIYFALVYLVGIFFTAGTHPPLGVIYSFLMEKIPGFVIFRSPYFKFAPTLFLATAFLIASLVDLCKGFWQKLFFVFLLLSWLGYHFPYFTVDFFSWQKNLSTRVKIPSYVFETSNWLNQEKKEEGRILLLPPHSRAWQFDAYRWGYLSLFPLLRLTTQEPILVNDAQLTDSQNYLLGLVYQSLLGKDEELFQKATSLLGIKYLILRNDVFWDLDWADTEAPSLYDEVFPFFEIIKPVRNFGQWNLYEIEGNRPLFDSAYELANLEMSVGDLDNYLKLNSDHFIVRETNLSVPKENLSSLIAQSYLKAECLSCRHEKAPIFALPERVLVLPDSPFYFLVSQRDKLGLGEETPKVAIYDYLGISLKRLVEVRNFIQQRKVEQEVKREHFSLYHEALRKMTELFDKLTDFETKYEAAYNLEFYLKNEENYLRVLLGEAVGNEDELKVFEETFNLIAKVREKVRPYLFEKEARRQLYLLMIDKPHEYDVLIRKEGLGTALIEGEEIKLNIDGQWEKVFKIESEDKVPEWINLGKTSLERGEHQLEMILPPLENLIADFTQDNLQMRTQTDQCFAASISGYDNRKIYKIEVDYDGGLTNDFAMYFTSLKNGKALRRVTKLGKEGFEETREELIYPDEKAENQLIGFCGPNLSSHLLKEKIRLRTYEIIHPLVLFVAKDQKILPHQPAIDYQRINPTRYVVKVKGANQPFVLSFLEAFDGRWRASLDGQVLKTHFIFDGFANGWKVDQPGDYQIIVEYQPQNIFYLGILISGLTFLAALVYLVREKRC